MSQSVAHLGRLRARTLHRLMWQCAPVPHCSGSSLGRKEASRPLCRATPAIASRVSSSWSAACHIHMMYYIVLSAFILEGLAH